MRLTVFDTRGDVLTESNCFVNADGWLEDENRSETFYLEAEIALYCFNEGGCYWGTLTDADDNVEAYFVFEGE